MFISIIYNTYGKDMRLILSTNCIRSCNSYALLCTRSKRYYYKTHEGQLQHISELHDAYDPLQYSLLIPYGEYGWHDNIFRENEHDLNLKYQDMNLNLKYLKLNL